MNWETKRNSFRSCKFADIKKKKKKTLFIYPVRKVIAEVVA